MHIDELKAMPPIEMLDTILGYTQPVDFWFSCGVLMATKWGKIFMPEWEEVYKASYDEDHERGRTTASRVIRTVRDRLIADENHG